MAKAKASTKAKGKAGSTKAKSATARATKAVTPAVEVEVIDYSEEADVGASGLSSEDRQFLVRTARFLVAVQAPRYVSRALKAGYDGREHKLALELWNKAAGRDRPFEHNLGAATVDTALIDPERLSRLRRLDTIENRFFPIMRNVIARFVPRDSRERFEAAFFKDLKQQPLGPLVVDSVKTFLTRFKALASSDEPGAREVFAQMRQRGLSESLADEALATIAGFEELGPLPVVTPNPAALAAARRAQSEALDDLKLFWNDWSTALRPMYDLREQVVLGLIEVRPGTGRNADEAPADPAPTPAPTP